MLYYLGIICNIMELRITNRALYNHNQAGKGWWSQHILDRGPAKLICTGIQATTWRNGMGMIRMDCRWSSGIYIIRLVTPEYTKSRCFY